MVEVIKQVGATNVVQTVTDNGSNFKKTDSKIMKKYKIYWTPCATYCIDLMLTDFRKTIKDAKTVTNFIYNHSFLLALMKLRECCDGDLIYP